MSSRPTDHANLDLAKLHEDVCFGRSGGKIIWQPRIKCWRDDKLFLGEPLGEPYDRLSYPDMFRHLGCSNRLYQFNACFEAVEDSRVRVAERRIGPHDHEVVWETPVGTQRAVRHRSPNHRSQHFSRWPVRDQGDLRVQRWRAERITWRWNQDTYDRLLAEWAGLGAPTMYMPRVTVQNLYIDLMGVEAGVYAMHDWPGEVRKYFAALNEQHDRLIEVINASPIRIVNFGDNVHSGTLPPEVFARYVLPAYRRRCERLHAAGKFVHAHWDGDCRPLLPLARETGLDGLEAVTPAPQGDVSLQEVKAALGEELFLLDGIPAIYFDRTFGADVLADCARRIIDLFAPRLVLGISDEISSTGEIERIGLVGRIVDEYNASVG